MTRTADRSTMDADINAAFRSWRGRHALIATLGTVTALVGGILTWGRGASHDDRNARSSDAWYLATAMPSHWRLGFIGRLATRVATPSGTAVGGENGTVRFIPGEVWEHLGARTVVVPCKAFSVSGPYGLAHIAHASGSAEGVIVRTDSVVWRIVMEAIS